MPTLTDKLMRTLTAAIMATVCACIALTGCHKPHPVQTTLAPRTPGPIKDLTAIRVGDEISLNWMTPRTGIRKLIVNGSVRTRVCRLEKVDTECIEAARPVPIPPKAAGTFTEELSASMRSGPPRVAYYAVELLDRNGSPTGLTNRVPVLIGAPPPPVEGLTAEMTQKGVVLGWNPGSIGTAAGETTIRLTRTEGPAPVATQAMRDGLVPIPARPEVEFSANDESGEVTDPDIRKGTAYHYRAQRVFRIAVDGQTLEMDGQISPEVEVDLPKQAQ